MHPISKCAANCICNGNAFLMNGIHWIFIWWNFHLLCTHTHVQGAGGKRDSISNERCKKLCIYLYKTHIHVSTSIQIDYIFFVFMRASVLLLLLRYYIQKVYFSTLFVLWSCISKRFEWCQIKYRFLCTCEMLCSKISINLYLWCDS